MNRIATRIVPAFAALALYSASASAVITLPGFAADDGTELFTPNAVTLNVELFDLGDLLGNPYEFGFYFGSDANNPPAQVTIFDEFDVGVGGAIALVNFNSGTVLDVDGSSIQSNFAVQSGPIGFWLSTGGNTYYSEAARNGGTDVVQTLQQLSNSQNYIIGYEISLGALDLVLGLEFVGGLTPFVAQVAEPATLALFGLGLFGVAYARRRKA